MKAILISLMMFINQGGFTPPATDFCGNPRPPGAPSIGAFDVNSGSNCENLSVSLAPVVVLSP